MFVCPTKKENKSNTKYVLIYLNFLSIWYTVTYKHHCVLPRSVFHVKLLIYCPVRQIESNIANNTNKIKLSHEWLFCWIRIILVGYRIPRKFVIFIDIVDLYSYIRAYYLFFWLKNGKPIYSPQRTHFFRSR